MKKLLCLCLMVLVLGALCITAGATGTERAILASSQQAPQGQAIAFSVTLVDCGEITGYTVELVYDATYFQLEGATWQPSDAPFGTDSNIGTFSLDAPAVPGNSPILSFTLRVQEDAPVDTVIPITCNITLHTEADDISVVVEPSTITITCPHDFQKNLTSEYLATPATCTEPAEYYKSCTRCGAIDETQTFLSGTALSHNFKDREMIEYLAEAGDCQNRDIYYVSCVACGLKGEQTFEGRIYGPHVFDNDCDAKCNVCFSQREVPHQPTTEWESNDKGHWHICTLCNEKVDYAKHIPGPAATEEVPQTCTECGYVVKLYEEHVHQYTSNWLTDENSHWQACECGDTTEPEEHPWDTTDPLLHICPVCGASKVFVPTPEQPTATTPTTPNTSPTTSTSSTEQTAHQDDMNLVFILAVLLVLSLIGNVVLLLLMTNKGSKKPKAEKAAEEKPEE